jgi:hypothetical protein
MVTEGKAPETVIPGKGAARLSESAETDCRCIRLAGDVCGDRLGRTDGPLYCLERLLATT